MKFSELFTPLWLWYNLNFTIPFILGALLVAKTMPKKEHYGRNLTLCSLSLFVFFVLFRFLDYPLSSTAIGYFLISHLTFLVQTVLLMILIRSCYQSDIWSSLFVVTIAYCLQHFSYRIFVIVDSVISKNVANWPFYYGITIWFVITVLCYFLWWYVLIRKADCTTFVGLVDKKIQLICSAIVIVVSVYANSLIAYYSTDFFIVMLGFFLSSLISFLIIILDYTAVLEQKAIVEVAQLNLLNAEEKRDYENSKINFDDLNIKLHDIKHILNTLGDGKDSVELTAVRETVDDLSVYTHTGNNAVDVIVNEVEKYCKGHRVKFTCLLDCKGLEYISDYELYSLFDNALTNAIQACEECPLEKRIVSVRSERKNSFLSLVFSNYYEGRIEMNRDLPMTKKDQSVHGFGMKSMKKLASQYGGTLAISTEDSIFTLTISLPTKEGTGM